MRRRSTAASASEHNILRPKGNLMTTSPAAQRPIVVGVDGSPASQEALGWGARQAVLTSAPLRAVIAWHWPVMYGGYGGVPVDLDLESDASVVLKQMVADLGEDVPSSGVQDVVQEGHPVQVLLDQAKDAALLVVGSRGHGAFAGMLLGSVSEHCVSHATCPVVVVRTEEAPDPAERV
jgi:nucleotide-binding universal stress UspA family protein